MDEILGRAAQVEFRGQYSNATGTIEGEDGAPVRVSSFSITCFRKDPADPARYGCGPDELAILVDWVPATEFFPDLDTSDTSDWVVFPRQVLGLTVYYKRGRLALSAALREKTPRDAEGKQICTSAVIVNDEGRILCGLNMKYGSAVWTTPGGRTEVTDADVEAALRREIAEETDLTQVKIEEFLGICPGRNPEVTMRVFRVRITSGRPRIMEPGLITEWRWMNQVELAETRVPFINPHILAMISNRP